MKKLLFCLCLKVFFIHTGSINLLREKIQSEQVAFVEGDLGNKEYIKNILYSMYQVDQEIRSAFIQDRENIELQEIIFRMDQFHTDKMKEMLDFYGWITISKFGVDADHQAWLLVQHADHDHEFQEAVLVQLTDLYQIGETNKKNYAYLYDRVALKSEKFGMKQKYGTQCFFNDNGEIFLRKYEGSLQDLDIARQQVNLGSVEEYMQQLKTIYKNKNI